MELESKVQERILKTFRKHKAYAYKNAQNIYTEKGRPDIAACVPVTMKRLKELYKDDDVIGLFMSVEVKRDKNGPYKATTAQQIVGKQIMQAGGLWYVLDDDKDVDAILTVLEGKEDGIC